ncbi:MAG: hypothetical protein WA885_18315 [Phormidesmis sp.]
MKIFTILNVSTSSRKSGGKRLAAAIAFSAASLSATSLATVGVAPAVAASDYYSCAAGMVAAGVPEDDAIAACTGARYPEDLGACVVDVSEFTGLMAETALVMCGRSRRPIEVANCTINIHDAFFDSPSTKVLENCGTSLLPERYGTCVVDIVDATEVAVDEALTQCIRAGYRPWRIQPRS